MNEVMQAIKDRRSVRSFKKDLLKKEELQSIVEAGIYAPTGHNQQPWHFLVIQDSALIQEVNIASKAAMCHIPVDWIQKMGENSKLDIMHGAPALIIVSAQKGSISGPTDCTAAMENMMIAAQSIGIGSCWMGFVNFVFGDAAMMKKLGVPEGYAAQQAAVFGYKSGEAKAGEHTRNLDVVTYVGSF